MALALGVSVVVAQPTITADNNGTDISTDLGLTWQDANPSTALSYIPSISGGSTAIEKITFGFSGSSNTHSGDSANYSASVATTTSSLLINGNNKGLQIGASGGGKIILDFGANNSKAIALNLDSVVSTEYGLKGNLEVSGTGSDDTFTGTFGGKGVSGSLLLGGTAKKVINFTGNAEIGSWIDGAGEREITFKGTATTQQIWNSGGGTATIVFENTANIQHSGSEAFHVQEGNSASSINKITFNNNATVQGHFSAWAQSSSADNKNIVVFKGQTNSITGNITAWGERNNENRNATNDLTFENTTSTNTITGNVVTSVAPGLKNKIIFNGQVSNKIDGGIQGGTGTNQITFNGITTTENTIIGEIKTTGGQNLIFFNQGTAKVLGNITSQEAGYFNGNNQLVFRTNSVLGDDSKKINIQIANSETDPTVGYNRHSYNTLVFDSQTTAKIANLSVSGDLGQKALTFNALSLNNDSSTLNIDSITAYRGSNIIGKGIVTFSSDNLSYNSSLFGSSSPSIQDTFVESFMQTTFQATGTFNFGSITANGEGTNYINVNAITLSGNIEADGGTNNINVNALNADSTQIRAVNYGKNIINIAQDTNISSITILATDTDHAYDESKITLNFSGDTLTIASGISTQGKWASSGINEINIKKDNATLTISSGGITTYKANESYDRQKMQQNNITFSNGGNLNLTAGNISVQHGNQNNFTFNGTNDITITLSDGSIQASDWQSINSFSFSGANNTINSSMTQTDGGENNITFLSDSSTLKLTGVTNQISTLTAKSGATTGDTLIIDSTNNANTTTINSIANGDSLIVNFKGQGENKGATLNLKNTPTLKQVVVNNNSTNNTLDLTQTTKTTINTKITIADTQQLAINLDNNTELALDTTDNNLGLTTTGSGISTINVSNTGTLSGGDIVATNLNLNGSSANATLKSVNTTFANLIAEGGTLTLGQGSTNATINSTNSTFNATFAGNSAQTLAINGGKNTITTLTLNAQTNTLSIGEGNTTITNVITSDTGNTLNLQIGNNSKSASLTLLDTIKTDNTGGGTAGVVNVVFAGTSTPSTLTLNGDNNILTSVNATNAGTLIANNASATITTLTGDKLTAGFSGNGASRIAINGVSPITLAGIVLNNNANGTLDLSSLENTTIKNNVNVGTNQSLAITLGGASSTLIFTGGLSGNATINAGATSNTIAGSSIALSNLNLSGATNTTTLTASNVAINTLNANATSTNTLKLDATSGNVSALINSIDSTTRSAGSLDIALNSGDNTTTLSLNGNTINSLDIQGDNNTLVGNVRIGTLSNTSANGTLNINGGIVEVTNTINPTSSHNMSLALNGGAKLNAIAGLNSGSDQINLALNNSTLSLGADSKITSLSGNGGVIDFVSSGKNTSKSLTITDNCNANANVITYVSGNQANIVEASNDTGSGTLTISAVGNADEIFSITYEKDGSNNVKVAQIGNSGTDKAVGGTSDIEGEVIQISLSTDGAGGYYIGSAISKGVDTSVQEVVTSALAVNYDLYLANFNSLNKRMGELRNTQESNGVWARVFGGAMSNDFGVGSKTQYVTTQAGYDYSLSVGENARNFIGIAIAYGASSTKSNPSSNPNTGVLDNISSSMVEVGLYNSYVADSGWYNDTIFKFDYIMSDFTLKTGANSQQNSTNNFAMILSDEFGYRYSFGGNEKGSWYIDPQLELAFGYFNQSDFNQALNESASKSIKATQDSILTLRSRVGASLGKKFNTDKGFASLYVGAFYEYDYIEGGKSDYSLISSGQEVSNPLQSLESNGRAILNVGSNIELTKGARLYIDVEKSFGDKQRTFMQFNLGARYSF